MKKIIVSSKYEGKNLAKFVLDSFPRLPQNQFYKALRKKDIRINNVKVNDNVVVHDGDEVTIYIVDNILYGKETIQIDKVYEDDNILVVNKPAGVEVVSKHDKSILDDDNSSIYNNEETLTSILKNEYSYIEPCHRLDRNTTGLVLFSKNEESLHILLEAFKTQKIEKHYKALVYGKPLKDHDILEAYLFKDSKKSQVYISDLPKDGYMPIKTEYDVINYNNDGTSLLDIILHTGRTHQIRAHLAYIGLPIIGDGKYGKNEINKQFGKTKQQLTAYKLKFFFTQDCGMLNYLNNKEISI